MRVSNVTATLVEVNNLPSDLSMVWLS